MVSLHSLFCIMPQQCQNSPFFIFYFSIFSFFSVHTLNISKQKCLTEPKSRKEVTGIFFFGSESRNLPQFIVPWGLDFNVMHNKLAHFSYLCVSASSNPNQASEIKVDTYEYFNGLYLRPLLCNEGSKCLINTNQLFIYFWWTCFFKIYLTILIN